jgi:ribosomal protein L37AE/L43A
MRTLGKFLAILGLILLFLYWPAGLICILIGLVMFAVGKDTSKNVEVESRKEQERPCPFCKEPVLKSAIKCKHCQSDIPAVEIEPPLNEIIKIENGLWECRNCHTKMLLAGEYCSKCRSHKKDIAIRKEK